MTIFDYSSNIVGRNSHILYRKIVIKVNQHTYNISKINIFIASYANLFIASLKEITGNIYVAIYNYKILLLLVNIYPHKRSWIILSLKMYDTEVNCISFIPHTKLMKLIAYLEAHHQLTICHFQIIFNLDIKFCIMNFHTTS